MQGAPSAAEPAPVAEDAAAATLTGLAPSVAAALRPLLTGAATHAPFLRRVMAREAAWLASAALAPPEATVDALASAARAADARDLEAVRADLRRARRRAALLIALADLGGVWDLEEVVAALTRFADAACAAAFDAALRAEAARAGLSSIDPAASGVFLLAMGKHGAGELNYSSDVDLILLYDPSRLPTDLSPTAKTRLPRVAATLADLLARPTADGFVLRVDFRLRPDPGATSVAVATDAALKYYSRHGRTWERAAHIKARVVAGDAAAGAAYLARLKPFVWRRRLDFAAFEETGALLRRIRVEADGERVAARGQDVKLGAGGIREIEFLAQAHQLIHGGRDAAARSPRTRDALRALADRGRLAEPQVETLDAAYVAHRRLEHRLQMIDDLQTHRIPDDPAGLARIAALSAADDAEAFVRETEARMAAVRAVAQDLDPRGAPDPARLDRVVADLPEPDRAASIVAGWRAGGRRALKTERAREAIERMAPEFLTRLCSAADPTRALIQFDRFLAALPEGVQALSLFEANPPVRALLAEICATAPRLADALARRPALFDAVLDRDFSAPSPGAAALSAELAARLESARDYEDALDAARLWAAERRFRVGVALLRGAIDAEAAAAGYSDVAEAALERLWPAICAEHARRYGSPPGGGAAVVAFGRLGSREMTAGSDLDLLVLYDAPIDALSSGDRPTPASQYYARLTQKLVAAVSAPTAEGALYEVDMRLRPSGNAGPLATSIDAFERYQRDDAWVWERMALTRARVVAGAPGVRRAATDAIAAALGRAAERARILEGAIDMRGRLLAHGGAGRDDPWAFREADGGLMDAAFVAQAGCLIAGRAAPGGLSTLDALGRARGADAGLDATLGSAIEAQSLLASLQQIERLALDGRFDPETAGVALRERMAATAGVEGVDALRGRVDAARDAVRAARRALFGS